MGSDIQTSESDISDIILLQRPDKVTRGPVTSCDQED